MNELTAADVRAGLLKMAARDVICDEVAKHQYAVGEIGSCVLIYCDIAARERATMAAEARSEGDR